MSAELETTPAVAAIENNFFCDGGKLSKSKLSDNVFQTSEKLQESPKADVDGRADGGENLDFTADILDLLLCVQNDENARQNIESIMDQWDEMSLLSDNDGSSKSNENSRGTLIGTTAHERNTSTKALESKTVTFPNTKESTSELGSTSVTVKKDAIVTQSSQIVSTRPADPSSPTESKPLFLIKTEFQHPNTGPEAFQKTFITKLESTSATRSPQQGENTALNVKILALNCSNCGKTYTQLMSSGAIPKIPSKPYPCPFCRGNYYQKSSAELHMKVHMEDDTLKCRLCSEASANFKRNGLGQSIDGNVNPLKRMKHDAFPCLICSAVLSSRAELEKHIRSHKKSSNNYRKSSEKDSEKKGEPSKLVCNECKKIFRHKADLDFHCLSHDSKFTKIVDKMVLPRTQSNILDHSYGKTNSVASPSTKMDENENLKTAEMNETTGTVVDQMEIDDLADYNSVKMNGNLTSLNSSTCDINSSYRQPNFSSSICDVSSSTSKAEPTSISSSSIDNTRPFSQSSQIFISSPVERNSSEGSFITDDSINFDQNLFKTFANVDTASSSGYDVLQQYLDEQPDEFNNQASYTSNVLLNSITSDSAPFQINNISNNFMFSDAKPSASNGIAATKVVNINPLIMSTKSAQNLVATPDGFGIKLPASSLKLGTNVLLGQNGAANTQANKSYVVMYVMPTQSTNSPSIVNPPAAQYVTRENSNAFVRLPAVDNKITYLVPVTNKTVSRQSPTVSLPNAGNQKANIMLVNKNVNSTIFTQSNQKIRPSTPAPVSKLAAPSETRLDPGKLHTAQPPPAKQIPVPNKRNILQLAYDDACKLIEDSIVQKSEETSCVPVVENEAAEPVPNSTLNGNYTLLKQMLNSKPRLSQNFVSENSKEHAPPLDNSFTHGQVTFQYQNSDQESNELASQPICSQYVCEVCQATLSNENYLSHLRTHSKTLYKCTYCQKIFVLQDNLVQHMKKHLQPPVFNCKMCSKTFSNVLLFKLHILVHKGLLFICVSCVKLFNKKEDYETHLRTHNEHDLSCVQCKRKFPNANGESNSNFVCPDCAVITATHVSANSAAPLNGGNFKHNHLNEMVTERTIEFEDLCFPCPYCDVLCSGGVEYKNHFSYHLTKLIKCFVCCEMFDKFALLASHMKTHTFARKFFCQYCAKKFPDRESYQNHYHPNFKPYSCMVCEQGLFNQTDLTVHAMNHDMTAKSCCNFCSEQFQSSDLDVVFSHKSGHLKDSIAECDICDSKFILYSELLSHISKLHDEEGKRKIAFKCTKCNAFLSNEEQLNEHELKHLKMDFVCQQCSASFIEFNELLRHWIKLHPKNTLKCFKCSCCSRFFLNESQWLEHAEQIEKRPVLLPYSLQQFGDRSFKLEPDTKKTYCCNQCNESFRSKVDIIKHMRRLQHK